ncbi:MAG TPA: MBL fold metallo-hydrolase [Candidatus Dormibacteraeota bacterium]|jgi:glyoxylase-like metal-dependent hydrolase (beta-lactamase superfamily II)
MTGRGTNTYVLGHDDQVVVVDPGPAAARHLAAIEASVKARGKAAIVLLTHHHPDHAEAAEEMARRLGAPLAGVPHPAAPRLDRAIGDSDELRFGGVTVRVLLTPGHCKDHACYLWEETAAVFAGDLLAGEGFIVVDPPEGNMTEYLVSLKQIGSPELFGLRGGASVLMPGHGPAIEDPVGYIAGYVAHRLQREEKVRAALLTTERRTVEQLLPVAYDDTPEAMYPVAARSLQAHLDKLVRDGRADVRDGGYRRLG